jgi:hypothetical protein
LSLEEVTLEDCVIHQLTVEEVTLTGCLQFHRSWLLLSDLVELNTIEGQHVRDLLTIQNCDILYCRLHGRSAAAAANHTNRRYPDPDIAGPEPELSNVPEGLDPWSQPA